MPFSRLPLTSCIVVLYAALLHLYEAVALLLTRSADGSIGPAALLMAVPRPWTAPVLILASVAALTTLRWKACSPLCIVLSLTMQQVLLFVTGIAAWFAVWHASYADGVARSHEFIICDQLPRGLFSLIHVSAIYAIAAWHAGRPVGEAQG